MDCIFCKIISGVIPSKKVFENEVVYAFEDISPQAPVHILVVPKEHFSNINELDQKKAVLMGELFLAIKSIAESKGISDSGYRVIINTGKSAGQEVFHLHAHILGGMASLGPMLCK